MIRLIALCLAVISNAAFACDNEGPSLALRDAIYSRDIDRVEALLDQNQKLFEAGQRSPEDARCLFRHFTKLRPATFETVDEWLKRYPDSPFAHTAKAWTNYVMSWQVRGDRFARDTYPAALSLFNELQRTAWDHSETAYRTRPRLIAASDALIKLANSNRQSRRREQVLSEVMATDPNEGTLVRAVAQVISGWGGTWDLGAAMCDTYAQRVPGAGPDATTRCKLPLARNFKDQWDWMNDTLASGDFPDFDYLRLDFILGPQASREEAEIAYRAMSEKNYSITRHLSTYDSLALKYDLPLLTETISKRRHANAERELEQSPLDLASLKVLGEPLLTSAKGTNGRLTVKVLERPTAQQALDYARRRVQASPYNPEAWSELLARMVQNGKITNLALAEPYRANAIVYDNHSAVGLSGYILDKIFEYDAFQRAQAGTLPADSLAMFDGVDETHDLICPVVRARRLFDAVCGARRQAGCDLDANVESAAAVIEAKAKSLNTCFRERTLPANEIAFTPMPLPDER